ncbi:MAG: hypothetical protein WC955_10235 [Elusimicrobiota bacterium]
MVETTVELEELLGHHNVTRRVNALRELKKCVIHGEVPLYPKTMYSNLHCHTIYSFNGYGFTPQRVVWEAFKAGVDTVGIVEFDVLDSLDEALEAGAVLGIKTVVGLETRVFVSEYAQKVMNSPKEPGVCYFMGTGFYKKPGVHTEPMAMMTRMRDAAKQRNAGIVNRINEYLGDVNLDYDSHVVPLTPAGNVTERHIFAALSRVVNDKFSADPMEHAKYWAEKIAITRKDVSAVIDRPADLQELIRGRLMKYGGVAYVQPDAESFPILDDVVRMIVSADALPTLAWLDGTNDGERVCQKYLEFMINKGVVAVNVIPERNWNVNDKTKMFKISKLHELLTIAQDLQLPVIAGTEMNKYGQRVVDDFTVPDLAPYVDDFQHGAEFIYGHTVMGKLLNKGFNSEWAQQVFPDRVQRTGYFTKIGELAPPGVDVKALTHIAGL